MSKAGSVGRGLRVIRGGGKGPGAVPLTRNPGQSMCPNPTAAVSGSNTVPPPGPPGCAEQPDTEQNGEYGH
jgi:hypothetical protein